MAQRRDAQIHIQPGRSSILAPRRRWTEEKDNIKPMMLRRFTLPELKVGTLDSLMVLSDDLVKVNSMLEAVVNKIRRQLFEMQAASSSSDDSSGEVLVENMPPDAYIEKFKWNEAKYPPRRPLSETVHTITETVSKLEEDLKVLPTCSCALSNMCS